MGKLISIKEAADEIGFSEYALRLGIKQGLYPYVRVGMGKGKIFLDLILLQDYLRQSAIANTSSKSSDVSADYGAIRQVPE